MYEAFFGMEHTPFVRDVPPEKLYESNAFLSLIHILSYFAIAGSNPYTSRIERSLDGSMLSISILYESYVIPVSYTHLDVYKRQLLGN